MKNFYSILGVTPDSSDAEIKHAYRTLARKFHPDVNPGGGDIFKDISQAYETLIDPKKRLQYDTINGFFKSSKKEETFTSSKKADDEYKKSSQTQKKENKHDFSKQINKILSRLNKKCKKEKPCPKRGSDIEDEISISIQDAIDGTHRIINVMHTTSCPNCRGRKFINGAKCSECDGSGEKNIHKKIAVKIPAGIKNGAKLKIKNEGNAGENGGANGDLYLKIIITSSSKMKFEGENVLYNLPITPVEAVLGTTISVPTQDGSVSLKIPPKTKNGQKFRLSAQGLKKGNKIGDMIVTVYIEIPSSLSDDEIKLYEKLKKMSSKDIRENLFND